MLTLSFSTINNCLQENNSHNWLNKQMGVEPEDKWYYHEGNDAHRIVQDHVAGIKKHPLLVDIKKKFEIVELVDRDPRCKFEFSVGGVKIIGYHDGKNKPHTKFLEIKSSGTPWSLSKFQKSMQRKIYGLSDERFKTSYLITCKRKPEEWRVNKPKIFKAPVTTQDRLDATVYINKAVGVVKKGDFKGGLDEDGKCTDRNCYYGVNCQFK